MTTATATEAARRLLTLGQVARRCGVDLWQVQRLVDSGRLPEPPRVGKYRVFAESDVPAIRAALSKAGFLPPD
jgi:hypothetical protein